MSGPRKPDPAELRARLTDEQYRVTQEKGTERPFTGGLLHNKERGVYACVVCGSELFESSTKYDSGSGWPSFWLPLAGERVRTHVDRSQAWCARRSCARTAARTSAMSATVRSPRGCATASIRHRSTSSATGGRANEA